MVWAYSLEGVEVGTSLFCSCGDAKPSSMEVVPYSEEDLKESELLMIYPLAVIEESGLPESASSYWVVQRVKNFVRFVGLCCEGFEDQMLAVFTAI